MGVRSFKPVESDGRRRGLKPAKTAPSAITASLPRS